MTNIATAARNLTIAQQNDNLDLITFRAAAALSLIQAEAIEGRVDQHLVDAIYSAAHWYIRHKMFDRAEHLYMTVMEAQEDVFGAEHPATSTTEMKMISLLRYEQKFAAPDSYDYKDAVVMYAQAS